MRSERPTHIKGRAASKATWLVSHKVLTAVCAATVLAVLGLSFRRAPQFSDALSLYTHRAHAARKFGQPSDDFWQRASFDPWAAAHEHHARPKWLGYQVKRSDWEPPSEWYLHYNLTDRLMKLFPLIDADHDNFVDVPELSAWHLHNRLLIEEARANRSMDHHDQNGDRVLTLEEWLADTHKDIVSMYDRHDSRRSTGEHDREKISAGESSHHGVGSEASSDDGSDNVKDELDVDAESSLDAARAAFDGVIDADEAVGDAGDDGDDHTWQQYDYELWDEYDMYALQAEDAAAHLRPMTNYGVPADQKRFHFARLFHAADEDRNGVLDLRELRHLLNPQLSKIVELRKAHLNMTLAEELVSDEGVRYVSAGKFPFSVWVNDIYWLLEHPDEAGDGDEDDDDHEDEDAAHELGRHGEGGNARDDAAHDDEDGEAAVLFRGLDADKDGLLDLDELVVIFDQMWLGDRVISRSSALYEMQQADTDDDFRLSLSEMLAGVHTFYQTVDPDPYGLVDVDSLQDEL